MKVDISKTSGKSSGKKITLSDKIFGIEPNDHAIYLDVNSYLKIRGKEIVRLKEDLRLLVLQEKLKNRKVQELPELEVLSLLSSRVVVKFLDLNQENIITRSTKKLKI